MATSNFSSSPKSSEHVSPTHTYPEDITLDESNSIYNEKDISTWKCDLKAILSSDVGVQQLQVIYLFLIY